MNRAAIRKRVEYWQKLMGLEFFDVGVTFIKSSRRKDVDRGNMLAAANCSTEPRYNTCTINFEPDRLRLVDDETIVHELFHCVAAEHHGYVQGMVNNWKGSKQDREDHNHWTSYFEEKLISMLTEIFIRQARNSKGGGKK